MFNTMSLPTRLACSLVLVGLLSACGSSEDLSGVRNGPQDVHPSPSELAKVPLHACGTDGQPACA